MPGELIGPLNEPFHVRRVRVAAVMLAPRKLAVEQALVYRRHLRCAVIALHIQSLGAKEHKDAARVHRCHETPLMIEPLRITLLRDPVADESQARRAKSDEFV